MGYGIAQTNTSGGTGAVTVQTVSLTGPTTITPPTLPALSTWLLVLNQDSTGGHTTTFPTGNFAGGTNFTGMLITVASTYSCLLFTVRASDSKSMLVSVVTGIPIP